MNLSQYDNVQIHLKDDDKKFIIASVSGVNKMMNIEYCYKQINERLPFGVHAWERWDKEFWLDIMDQNLKV